MATRTDDAEANGFLSSISQEDLDELRQTMQRRKRTTWSSLLRVFWLVLVFTGGFSLGLLSGDQSVDRALQSVYCKSDDI